MSTRPQRYLHADAASVYLTPSAPAKMHPSEIALTLSADVLRLPYPPATRLVLAEIVSLHAATGLCDASDKHFADRLTISTDTASRAVQQLEAEGLLVKTVKRLPTGFYRTLVPNPAAITAKAQTNPYPQNAGSNPQNAGREPSRKMPVAYPQNAATPTRKMPVALPAKCGSNTPLNLPGNFQETPTPSAGKGPQKKIGPAPGSDLPHLQADDSGNSPPVARPPHDGEHFAALWETWPKKEKHPAALAAFAQLSADEQAAAASRADAWLAARPDQVARENGRYLPQLANWLSDERWTDANPTQPVTTQAHVTHPTSYPPRSVNGAKPAGNGGKLARALVEGG